MTDPLPSPGPEAAAAAPEPTPAAAPPSHDQQMLADVFGLDIFDEKLRADEPSADPSSPVGTAEAAGGEAPAASPPAVTTPTQAPGSATQVQQQPGTTPAPATPAPAGQPATTPATEPAPTPVDPALKIASLEAQIAELRATPAPATPPAGQPDSPPAFNPTAPEIMPVQLPTAVLTQIFGDEPSQEQAAALNGVLSAIASSTLHRARLEMHYHLNDIRSGLQSKDQLAEQQQAEAQAETQRAEYFAAFPHQNSPLILPILREETGKLAAELPGAKWDAAWMAALGARVDGVLTSLGVQLPGPGSATATQSPGVTPPAVVPATTPARPAAMMPTGSRPAPEPEDIVNDTFSWD